MNEVDVAALASAAQRARLVLRRPRQERVSIVKQMAGSHYSEEGSPLPVPCNVLSSYASIVGRKLSPQNLKAMLSTDDRSQRRQVATEETWINEEIERP